MTLAIILLFFTGCIVVSCLLNPEEFREFLRELRGSTTPALAAGLALPPADYFLDQGHSWSSVEPAGTLRVGAGPVLLALLGKPDAVSTPRPGTALRAGDRAVTLTRGHRTLDVAAAVDGEVVEVNEAVLADPGLMSRDPYGSGWLVRVAPAGLAPVLEGMKVADEARQWVRDELSRLRDSAASMTQVGAAATMLDGGLPIDGLSEHLDDDTWEHLVREVLGA